MKDSNWEMSNQLILENLQKIEKMLANLKVENAPSHNLPGLNIFYQTHAAAIRESYLLRKALLELNKMRAINLKYCESLILSPHKETLQQAMVYPNELGLTKIEDKLEALFSNPDIIPAITAFKEMGGKDLESIWPQFQLPMFHSTLILMHKMGLGDIQKKWPEFAENSESLSLLISSMHDKNEKITEKMWDKLVLKKTLPYLLFRINEMGATTLIDKIDKLDKIEELGKKDKLLESETNLSSKLINAFEKMHASDIDKKLDLLIADPEFLPWIIGLSKAGSTELDAKWSVIESKNSTLLESIYAFKKMRGKDFDSKWEIFTTQELLPKTIIALEKMGLGYISCYWEDFFYQDLDTACEALLWAESVGIRPASDEWYFFSKIYKTHFPALKEMNIENPATKWIQLEGNQKLQDCILILRRTDLKLNESVWEALTQKKDLLKAIFSLNKLKILDLKKFQKNQWTTLLKDEGLIQSLVALKNFLVFDNGYNLWQQLKLNYSLRKCILMLKEEFKEEKFFYLSIKIYKQPLYRKVLFALKELDVLNIKDKLSDLESYDPNPLFPKVIIALNSLNHLNLKGKEIDVKWHTLKDHLIVQNIIITLAQLKRKKILSEEIFANFIKLFDKLPNYNSKINNDLLKELKIFLESLKALKPLSKKQKLTHASNLNPKKTTSTSKTNPNPSSTQVTPKFKKTEISLEGLFDSPEELEDKQESLIHNNQDINDLGTQNMKDSNSKDTDASKESIPTSLIEEVKNALIEMQGEELYKTHEEAIKGNPDLQQAILVLKKAGIQNIKPLWDNILKNRPLSTQAIPLYADPLYRTKNWNTFLSTPKLLRAPIILKQHQLTFPNVDFDLGQELSENEHFQNFLIRLDDKIKAGKVEGHFTISIDLFRDPHYQSAVLALIDCETWDATQKKDRIDSLREVSLLHEMSWSNPNDIEKGKFLLSKAILAIKKMGGTIEPKWYELQLNFDLQKAMIALAQTDQANLEKSSIDEKWDILIKERKNLSKEKSHSLITAPTSEKLSLIEALALLEELNFKTNEIKWDDLFQKPYLRSAIYWLKELKAKTIEDKWQGLKEDPSLVDLLKALKEIGVFYQFDKKWSALTQDPPTPETITLRKALFALKNMGFTNIDIINWETLIQNPTFQKTIIAFKQLNGKAISKKWPELLKNTKLQEAIIALEKIKMAKIDEEIWAILSTKTKLQDALIALAKMGESKCEIWPKLVEDSLLQDTLIALENMGATNIDQKLQELEKKPLQQKALIIKALTALHELQGKEIDSKWKDLIESEPLDNALVMLGNMDTNIHEINSKWAYLKNILDFIEFPSNLEKDKIEQLKEKLQHFSFEELTLLIEFVRLNRIQVSDSFYDSYLDSKKLSPRKDFLLDSYLSLGKILLHKLFEGNSSEVSSEVSKVKDNLQTYQGTRYFDKEKDDCLIIILNDGNKYSFPCKYLIDEWKNINKSKDKSNSSKKSSSTEYNKKSLLHLYDRINTINLGVIDTSKDIKELDKHYLFFSKQLKILENRSSELDRKYFSFDKPKNNKGDEVDCSRVITDLQKTLRAKYLEKSQILTKPFSEELTRLENLFDQSTGKGKNVKPEQLISLNELVTSLDSLEKAAELTPLTKSIQKLSKKVETALEKISPKITSPQKEKDTSLKKVNNPDSKFINRNSSQPKNVDISKSQSKRVQEQEKEKEKEKALKSIYSENDEPKHSPKNNSSFSAPIEPKYSNENSTRQKTSNNNSSRKKTFKKSFCGYFFLKGLTILAGLGATFALVASIVTYNLPLLAVGAGLLGATFFFNQLSNSSDKKSDKEGPPQAFNPNL